MANKNRKNVYFSKQNQDLKEFVEEFEPDFSGYVMDLIRRDMDGEDEPTDKDVHLSHIQKQLEQTMDVMVDLNNQVIMLQEQLKTFNVNPFYYQMPSFPQQMTPYPVPPQQPEAPVTKEEVTVPEKKKDTIKKIPKGLTNTVRNLNPK